MWGEVLPSAEGRRVSLFLETFLVASLLIPLRVLVLDERGVGRLGRKIEVGSGAYCGGKGYMGELCFCLVRVEGMCVKVRIATSRPKPGRPQKDICAKLCFSAGGEYLSQEVVKNLLMWRCFGCNLVRRFLRRYSLSLFLVFLRPTYFLHLPLSCFYNVSSFSLLPKRNRMSTSFISFASCFIILVRSGTMRGTLGCREE